MYFSLEQQEFEFKIFLLSTRDKYKSRYKYRQGETGLLCLLFEFQRVCESLREISRSKIRFKKGEKNSRLLHEEKVIENCISAVETFYNLII